MPIKQKIYNFLRQSERYTKTDMIYLAKGGFWLTFRQAIFSISALLVAIAFARLLPKEVYGNYKFILSVTGILAISALNRIDTAVILAVARGFEKVAKEAFRIKIKWSLWGSLAALGLAIYFYFENNAVFTISFLLSSIFLPLMESSQIYLSYLNGKKQFDLLAKYNSIVRIIASAGLILAIFLSKNLILIILIYFFLYTSLRTYFLFRAFKKLPPNQKTNSQYIPYGKELSFIRIIVEIANYLDKILVFTFLGAAQLAIYVFATIPITQINNILQSLSIIAMPKFSANLHKQVKKTLPAKIIKAMLIIIILVIIYIVLAPCFYQLLFPQYLESIHYSRFFAFTLILFPMTLISSYFHAQIKKREVYLLSFIPPTIRIILLLAFAPVYGITGVISAILIAGIVNALLSLMLFRAN